MQVGPWFAGIGGMHHEHDLPELQVEGNMPQQLQGTLYRNGAGSVQVGEQRYAHWFDGDGMVSAFRFANGTVSYRNRFVQTDAFRREQAAGRMLYPNFGTVADAGWHRNAFRAPKNPANTNSVPYCGRLLNLWEGGRPWSMDPETLETLGVESFEGTLPRGVFFSAHPHIDPDTGDMYNVGPVPGPVPWLKIWHVTPQGTARVLRKIRMHRAFMVHDFALTKQYIIILGGPFYLNTRRVLRTFLRGDKPLLDAFEWHPEEGTKLYVVPRDPNEPMQIHETDSAVLFHIANAFDDKDDIVVDAAMYPDESPLRIVADVYQGKAPADQPGILQRIRIPLRGGTVRHETLSDTGIDFPRINEQYQSRDYRYTYPLEFEAGNFASSRVRKFDLQGGRELAVDFGAGCYAGEPVYVTRDDKAEDSGWLLSLVYDANRHKSFVGVVDATDMQELARIHLPFHVPIGFHGNFLPA